MEIIFNTYHAGSFIYQKSITCAPLPVGIYLKSIESLKTFSNDFGAEYLVDQKNLLLDSKISYLQEQQYFNVDHASEVAIINCLVDFIDKRLVQGHQIEENTSEVNDALKVIENYEGKFWNGVPVKVAINHFKVLCTTLNKRGQPYLTTEQFSLFIHRGLLKHETYLKQTLDVCWGDKVFVIGLFYDFYALATKNYNHPCQTENFLKLFTNCFENWGEKTVKYNLKPNKTKKTWDIA